jgi:hypothetical protein
MCHRIDESTLQLCLARRVVRYIMVRLERWDEDHSFRMWNAVVRKVAASYPEVW